MGGGGRESNVLLVNLAKLVLKTYQWLTPILTIGLMSCINICLLGDQLQTAAEMDGEMAQSESASHYEFDAPSHVIDFKALDTEDNADIWFGKICSQVCAQYYTVFWRKSDFKS